MTMRAFASNTGTKKNLAALREYEWDLLLTPDNPTPRDGFHYGCDNGAWRAYQQGEPFNERKFWKLIEPHGAADDWVVVPDIVAGGMKSFDFSLSWLSRLSTLRMLLFPVQDGMIVTEVCKMLRRETGLGIFVGGTTAWKLHSMPYWAGVAKGLNRYCHVGRVNTVRRIKMCAEAGVDSFDGTSATKYSVNLPMLDAARRQPNLFSQLECGREPLYL